MNNERFFWNEGPDINMPWNNNMFGVGADSSTRDLIYMREMYPQSVRRIQDIVAAQLDIIDYAASFIYDEYPDKYMLWRIVARIKDMYMADENNPQIDENVLKDIITILVLNEIYRRRRKKWW